MEFYENFEFDRNKSRRNMKEHGVSFYEGMTVFSSFPLLTENDDLHSEDEERYKTTGYSNRNRLLVVIHTDRGNKTRIISTRKANKSDERRYHEYFK